MNRLSDEVGVSSPNQVPAVFLTGRNSSKADDSEDVSSFISSFRQVIVEVSKEASIAAREVSREATLSADQRHRENKEDQDRRHTESLVAKDKRVVMKNDLVNKGYLKRRIDTLQDEARSMRFKIFECQEANKKNKSNSSLQN
jgi:hypothetical protein